MSYFTSIKKYLKKKYLKDAHHVVIVSLAAIITFILLVVVALVIVPEQKSVNGLNTLRDIKSYAHFMPELPPMDNTNMVRPDYGLFHRSNNSWYVVRKWRSLLSYLHLSSRFTWSPVYFKSLIDLTLTRLKSYKVEKNIIYKITPTAKTQLVVIGDLSGAYHSLVRDIQKMFELKIIDDSLKIIAPDTFIIFMGDAISRSPYGMETLGLILRLLEMNPDTVIYMRGNHEDNKYWEAFGLKDQLDIRLGLENSPPVIESINGVFTKLPLGLYVGIPGEANHFLRISHLSSAESTKLKEDNYAHFLEAKQQGVLDRYEIEKTTTHNNKISIDGVINSEKKRHTFQVSTGLRQLPADGGAIAWTLLSAPTLVNQKGLKFVDDAFVVIQLAEKKQDWKITSYTQDSTKKEGFIANELQFFTGMKYAEKKSIELSKEVAKEPSPVKDISPGKEASPVVAVEPTKELPKKEVKEEPKKEMPLIDILSPEKLKRAIASRFIQQLITPKKIKKAPEKKSEVGAPALMRTSLQDQIGTHGAIDASGVSLHIGKPRHDTVTHMVTIPLTISLAGTDTTINAAQENSEPAGQGGGIVQSTDDGGQAGHRESIAEIAESTLLRN